MRKRVVAVGALLSWFAVAGGPRVLAQFPPLPPPLPPPPILAKLDPLLQPHASSLTGTSRVIVRATSAASVGAVATLITVLGGTLGRQLPILDARVAVVPNAALAPLSNSPIVQRIAADRVMLGFNDRTAATVGATAVRQDSGYDGAGIGVAVIDSGITPWHDDLADPNVPGSQRVDQFVDYVNGQQGSYDDFGHGTHVAGIIAGNGFDSSGLRTGIAPASHLVVLKVLNGSGGGNISNVIAAFDYVLAHKTQYNIRVVNLSVGAGVFESYNSDFLTQAAKRVVDQGIVVVAAAGNLGRDSQGHTQYGGITAPGNAPWVLTVGASSHMGTTNRADDTIAAFSSRGPTAVDRIAKPDLVAPGVGIESLSAPSSSMYQSRSQYLLSGTVLSPSLPYLSLSGTSQATPVVSGTVALMLQANPTLTPNAVKAILQYTAESHATNDPLTQGAGFLNTRAAIDLVRYFAAPSGTPYPSTTGWSSQLIWGTQRVYSGFLMPSAIGWGLDAVWGAVTTSAGQNVAWGVYCATTGCGGGGGTWSTWGSSCSSNCSTVVWGGGNSNNVVWGADCGGADCQGTTWSASGEDGVVWGSDAGDAVVWGSTGDDAVVWGSTDAGDAVVWGSSCNTSACESMIWPR